MVRLLRNCAALIVVYSIALQALLLGFVPAGHFGFDPFAIICSAESSEGHNPAVPQQRSDCDVCLAACSNAPVLVPASVMLSLVLFSDRPKPLTLLVETTTLQSRHQPQESRAPPTVS